MKIRGHGTGIAIALGGVAVVLASTGTAVAVVTSSVTISDPTTPSHVARVDAAGRLTTVGAVSTIDVIANVGFDRTDALTGPTTAQLAVTTLSLSDPQLNSQFTGTTLSVALVKIKAGTTGNCVVGTDGAAVERLLGNTLLEPGDDIVKTYPVPLLVKPTGTARYCLGLMVSHIGGTQSSLYLSTVQLTAYAASGTYTGAGSGANEGAAEPAPAVLQTR